MTGCRFESGYIGVRIQIKYIADSDWKWTKIIG
jgi:hypothetical protein